MGFVVLVIYEWLWLHRLFRIVTIESLHSYFLFSLLLTSCTESTKKYAVFRPPLLWCYLIKWLFGSAPFLSCHPFLTCGHWKKKHMNIIGHQLIRFLSTDIFSVPHCALWRICEQQCNLCAWSLCSLRLTQTHIWGRLCVLSVYSLPSLSRQWSNTVLSIESLLCEREKHFSWILSVEIE